MVKIVQVKKFSKNWIGTRSTCFSERFNGNAEMLLKINFLTSELSCSDKFGDFLCQKLIKGGFPLDVFCDHRQEIS